MDEEYEDQWLASEAKQSPQSMFHKQVVTFTNADIENNIDQRMKTPIYNIQLQDLDQQQPEDEQDKQNAKTISEGKNQDSSQKTEALFDPLQDQDNQTWMKKHFKKSGRALCCPACFNQVAFNYQIEKQNKQDILYSALQVFSAEVKENVIVRQKDISEKMEWTGVDSKQAEKLLKQREEEFNIKIVVECNCGFVIGYYDINKQHYMLTNVI